MWNNAWTNFLAEGLHKENTRAIICKNIRGIIHDACASDKMIFKII